MKHYVTIFFISIAHLFSCELQALNRDYPNDCDEYETYQHHFCDIETFAVSSCPKEIFSNVLASQRVRTGDTGKAVKTA